MPTHDDPLEQCRRAAASAGLWVDSWNHCGSPRWLFYHGERLLLTWLPLSRRATAPSPLPSVPCGDWRAALALAIHARPDPERV